jgi:hypothetical protein
MKKIVASVGLVALGASALDSASAQVLTSPDSSKPWSVSATLRGFYDDNTGTVPNSYNTSALNGAHRDSWGWEVSPAAALSWSVEQTTLNLGMLYSLKYYQNKVPYTSANSDQVFTFNAGLDHSFSERYKIRVNDSFVIGQEPDLLRAGNTYSTFEYVSGDNIRNYGSIAFDAQLTPEFGIDAGYDNSYFDYSDSNPTVSGGQIQASTGGTLNRIENMAHVEGLYNIRPQTKVLLGAMFTDIDYTGDQLISGTVLGPFLFNPVYSDYRNSRMYTGYAGVENNFTPELRGAFRLGVSSIDFYNADTDNQTSPYINGSLSYTYAPQSAVTFGSSYNRNPTDVIGLGGNNNITLDAESQVVFLNVHHRITPNLFGTLLGQFQNSKYYGGTYDDKKEQFYVLGVDMEYRFNQYLSSHVGYNYDNLGSEIGRHYDRNRVYLGVTATY